MKPAIAITAAGIGIAAVASPATAATVPAAPGDYVSSAQHASAANETPAAADLQVFKTRVAWQHLMTARAASQRQPTGSAPGAPIPRAQAHAARHPQSPQQVARSMLRSLGWPGQFGCLDSLWSRESKWSVTASNPDGAYGIPQALPGSKMGTAGPRWQTDAATQIRWGLRYIKGLYGSPCGAWSHEKATGWY